MDISVKQAAEADIPVIEGILLNTVNWLKKIKQPLWGTDEVRWDSLSKNYQADNFYIAYIDDVPSGCMVLVDYDPFFWPDVKLGESLFIHKLAVVESARKSGAASTLLDFAKEQGRIHGVDSIRLDTHALRPRLRAFYERHGFVCVNEKVWNNNWYSAFYEYPISKD